MVLTKEYRVCMPLTVEEYQIGQLYMVARHSLEQSNGGDGVEVIENRECVDPEHGTGNYTEKRIHLSNRLPYWVQSLIPKVFYITEKAWNYYPYTFTEYTCSFLPKLNISIYTRYENNNGSTENCVNLSEEELANRTVDYIDIAYDELHPKHYKEEEDLKYFHSKKTSRGPLVEGWRDNCKPIMCSYKVVKASLEIWGFQTRLEEYVHSCIREVLLLGHKQAFAWIDEWIEMGYDDVKEYESNMQLQTNKFFNELDAISAASGDASDEIQDVDSLSTGTLSGCNTPNTPSSPKTVEKKGYFSSWF